jgi:hypothetical protein
MCVAELSVIHQQCLTYHTANRLWETAYKSIMLAKLLALCKRLINWADVPRVMFWMSGTPPLVTACRYADTRETCGLQSANIWHRRAFSFCDCMNYCILNVKTTSLYQQNYQYIYSENATCFRLNIQSWGYMQLSFRRWHLNCEFVLPVRSFLRDGPLNRCACLKINGYILWT